MIAHDVRVRQQVRNICYLVNKLGLKSNKKKRTKKRITKRAGGGRV